MVDVHHRRSPLVQGGLEIPIELTTEMECSEKNKLCIKQYETLVREKYKEPIDGMFEDATASIFKGLDQSECSDNSELEL